MKLKKRIKHTSEKDRVITDLDIMIYDKNIIWYMAETLQYEDGDEFTVDQEIEDYIQNGPPEFAADLPDEIIREIEMAIKVK